MQKPPKPPDLTPISDAQLAIAREANELAREQMGLSREQYNFFREMSLEELGFSREQAAQQLGMQQRGMEISERGAATMERLTGAQTALMDQAREYGARDRARWESVFLPLQDRFIRDAQEYDTPERREMEAGRAIGEITAQADQQRRNADARLASMGLDPSQFRSASIAATMGAQTAAAGAQAANNTRRAVEDKGRALIADSIGLGMGLPAQATTSIGVASGAGANAAGAAGGATSAGLQGISTAAGLGTSAAGLRSGALNNMGSLTGSPMQWAQLGSGSMGMAGNMFGNAGATMTQNYNNQMSYNQANNNRISGMLSLAGGVMGMFAEGGRVYKTEGGMPTLDELGMGLERDVIDLPRDSFKTEFSKPVTGESKGKGLSLKLKDNGKANMKLDPKALGKSGAGGFKDRFAALGRGLSAAGQSMAGQELIQSPTILRQVQLAEGGTARRGLAIPRKQARDTVPAMLAEGEYVIPADVVAALGINHFDKLVAKHHRPGA